jgi:hypothetical protein
VWTSYFRATVLPALPAQPSLYVVDITSPPAGCLTTWTAVSANMSAVQRSPASGTGRGQVELFMPANTGDQRSTLVTIAGQTASLPGSTFVISFDVLMLVVLFHWRA